MHGLMDRVRNLRIAIEDKERVIKIMMARGVNCDHTQDSVDVMKEKLKELIKEGS